MVGEKRIDTKAKENFQISICRQHQKLCPIVQKSTNNHTRTHFTFNVTSQLIFSSIFVDVIDHNLESLGGVGEDAGFKAISIELFFVLANCLDGIFFVVFAVLGVGSVCSLLFSSF